MQSLRFKYITNVQVSFPPPIPEFLDEKMTH